MKDQTAHFVQSDLDLHCPQKLLVTSSCRERVKLENMSLFGTGVIVDLLFNIFLNVLSSSLSSASRASASSPFIVRNSSLSFCEMKAKIWTLPFPKEQIFDSFNLKDLQTTILNSMKMAESYPNG